MKEAVDGPIGERSCKQEVKACICQIVKQIWLLPFMHCLNVLKFHKHNSLPLGQIQAFIFFD